MSEEVRVSMRNQDYNARKLMMPDTVVSNIHNESYEVGKKGERGVMTFSNVFMTQTMDGKNRYHVSALVEKETFPEATAETQFLACKLAVTLAILVMQHKKLMSESKWHKHETSLLMEKCQLGRVGLTFLPYTVNGEDHILTFSTAVMIDDLSFPRAFGATTKDCKKEASRIAFIINYTDMHSFSEEELTYLCTPLAASPKSRVLPKCAVNSQQQEDVLLDLNKDHTSVLQEYVSARRGMLSFVERMRGDSQHEPICLYDTDITSQDYNALKLMMPDTVVSNIHNESYEVGKKGERGVMTFSNVFMTQTMDGKNRYHVSALVEEETFPEATAETQFLACKLAVTLAILVMQHKKLMNESKWHKHETSLLMEKCQLGGVGLTFLPYTVNGEDHIPTFSTAVVIDDLSFPRAFGATKKDCKKEASRIAFIINYTDMHSFSEEELTYLCTPLAASPKSRVLPKCAVNSQQQEDVLLDLTKDHTSVLQEYVSARRGMLSFVERMRGDSQHEPIFYVECHIDGVVIATGVSSRKITAKKMSSHNALLSIISDARAKVAKANQLAAEELGGEASSAACWSDYACALSHRVLEIVEAAQLDHFVKEKIVAAFVMKEGDHHPGVVVSLGTGNRCILGKHLTTDGCKVHHSHAEVVARRGLLRFLYHELRTFSYHHPHRLFHVRATGEIRLRPNITFHLYISRPPCGDASSFISINSSAIPRKQQHKQGLLRCLMEDGEGAIPSQCEPQKASLSSVKAGEHRLRAMTCSDKICSWNVIGVQGALLSQIIGPVYVQSIIIGSSVGQQKLHIPRAVSHRLVNKRYEHLNQSLPRPFELHHPAVLHVTDGRRPRYELNNSRPYSLNWCVGDGDAEVIDGMRGDSAQGTEVQPSRISKFSLFKQFHEICAHLGVDASTCYKTAKQAAHDYNLAKRMVIQRFLDMGYGYWVSFPAEANKFFRDES